MFFEVSFCRNCCEASIFGKGNESFLTRSLGFLPLLKKKLWPLNVSTFRNVGFNRQAVLRETICFPSLRWWKSLLRDLSQGSLKFQIQTAIVQSELSLVSISNLNKQQTARQSSPPNLDLFSCFLFTDSAMGFITKPTCWRICLVSISKVYLLYLSNHTLNPGYRLYWEGERKCGASPKWHEKSKGLKTQPRLPGVFSWNCWAIVGKGSPYYSLLDAKTHGKWRCLTLKIWVISYNP